MEERQIVVGLDIGTKKVCAIAGAVNAYGKLEVIGIGTALANGVRQGAIYNNHHVVNAVLEAIEKLEKDADIDVGVVNVGISGAHVRMHPSVGAITRRSQDEITASDINRLLDDMHKTVLSPGQEILHVLPQYYAVDHERKIKEPIGMPGVRLEGEVQIVTSGSAYLANLKRCMQLSRLEVEHLMLNAYASSLSILAEEEKEAGVALIDIGAGTTEVVVFYDGFVRYTSVLPMGGELVTSDIREGCKVLDRQAEQLKQKFGCALRSMAPENEYVAIPSMNNIPPREIALTDLSLIIQARMEEIIDACAKELQKSGFAGKLAGGVVVSGGEASLRGLTELFQQRTGYITRVGYPNIHLGKCKNELIKDPKYATAIGLALASSMTIDKRDMHLRNAPKPAATVTPSPGFHTMIPRGGQEELPPVEVSKPVVQPPVVQIPPSTLADDKKEEKQGMFTRFMDKMRSALNDDFAKHDY